MPLWQIDIYPADGFIDREGLRTRDQIRELGLGDVDVTVARTYLVEGPIDAEIANSMATTLLADTVTERTVVGIVGDELLCEPPGDEQTLVHVMPKPGVMDPVAQSTIAAARDNGWQVDAVRTVQKFWLPELDDSHLQTICRRALSNDSVDQVIIGPLQMTQLAVGGHYEFALLTVPIRELDDDALVRLAKDGQLYLTLVEMQTIRDHFREMDRDPTDIELETIAQTWSEHCSHKTLGGRIHYRGPGWNGEPLADERQYDNMLKQTIFAATQTIRQNSGDDDICVSVFKDNAGIVKFDDAFHACIKVETHNHPSALEPYGGANTGMGGVIRDPLGTGMGARPVCNTDVFCFAPPDTPADSLPPGVLHPRRVIGGVVAGVRDYGNRMGIPTVNGAVYFDKRYLGNPLVYCGNVAIIPVGMEFKRVEPGDLIVAMGGRTGRDGIHGATFSSAELTSESESLSGGAVQIGNAITEKMVMDVLLQARDAGLYNAVTDCGAGGFSSAVGEMGEDLGAEVWLEKCPLKYDGLTYTEIWISEAQERMVLAVPPENWEPLRELCESEGVEVAAIGEFVPTGRLHLTYKGHTTGDVSMQFLHGGRPPIIRDAIYQPPPVQKIVDVSLDAAAATKTLYDILGSLNVASKHWIIRQYDHEVQGGSVIKPLVGPMCDGPGDAAVVRPRLESPRGLVVSCGMNPHFGDFDTYHMAASAIDEAMRNAVCVGADPSRIAILDNFCWGYTDRPETLGSLVRAAIACQDMAVGLGTPFVSGKDSLNNEFSYFDEAGEKRSIAIPPSLLITALGQIADVATAVTMDFKTAGNVIVLVGETGDHLGGSHYAITHSIPGGNVPTVDVAVAKRTFAAVHAAIEQRWLRSCHDCSEGGLATAIAEMSIAGRLGADVDLANLGTDLSDAASLFSESNTRFVIEVRPEHVDELLQHFASTQVAARNLGTVTASDHVTIRIADRVMTSEPIAPLMARWKEPLDW